MRLTKTLSVLDRVLSMLRELWVDSKDPNERAIIMSDINEALEARYETLQAQQDLSN